MDRKLPLNQSGEEVVVVDVTYENEVSPQRQEIVQTTDVLYGSAEDDEEIEVTYDNFCRLVAVGEDVLNLRPQ